MPPDAPSRPSASVLFVQGESRLRTRPCYIGSGIVAGALWFAGLLCGQTAATGALTGVVLDPSGAVVPGAIIELTQADGHETKIATSNEAGRFGFLSLLPGKYGLQTSKSGFRPLILPDLQISVTETLRLDLHLQLAASQNTVQVYADPLMIQLDTAALGRVVNESTVSSLPLATRNFAQIAGLSPGVVTGVFNAGELGLGGTGLSQIDKSNNGVYVHGARSYDNNWQLDGVSVSDVQGAGSSSGGIPSPNPDAIQEFKVQTGLYDAAFGRYAGANVSIVTKIGGSALHGSIFEYFRNDVLNANDFFLKQAGQRRPNLKQNQFGFALGGPIKNEKLFFFGSYQGTRQVNGLAAGQARIACTASLSSPPLTDNRTPAALGQLFGGMSGVQGGVTISPDGSNVNPVAVALLNFRLPDGSYLIPTPQTVDPAKPLATQGYSAFSQPCHFQENQVAANISYVASPKSRIVARLFLARSSQTVTFPGGGLNMAGNIHGFTSPGDSGFTVFSIAHSYMLSNGWLNEARIAYVRTRAGTEADAPFRWSDIGVAEGEMNRNNDLPGLRIAGSVSLAPAFPRTYTQNSFVFNDSLSLIHGAHAMRLGGSLTRLEDNLDIPGAGSFIQFLSWPDFLLGLSASGNGSAFSNVFASADLFGLLDRRYRVWEGSGFAQDDIRIGNTLTLNVGLRYEHFGQFGDKLGRNSSFDVTKADANPPSGGSLAGYIVASNFPGIAPADVLRAGNTFANYGLGQHTIAPRVGLAWQILPRANWLVLRGGYGIYYTRPTGQAFSISATGAPFASLRRYSGLTNSNATFQAPFEQPFPTVESFPLFVPYSPTTQVGINTPAPGLRPAMTQQFSLNIQGELHDEFLLEAGYVGTRGTRLQRLRSLNQALDASGGAINGANSNTLANIGLRVPIPGIPADSLRVLESDGSSWYNALELSLTKRFSHGLQFLASYTFSKTLDSDGADINGTSAGNALTLGDQNSSKQRWGRASFDRTHRFVFSAIWTLPAPSGAVASKILEGWSLAGVATIQSGSALTIANTNATNVFGISQDRAQLIAGCSKDQLVTNGPVASKLNGYFNKACFTTPPIIGADGIGTAFGNSGTGIVDGPGQANLDLAISKTVSFDWLREGSSLEFRMEFFNALNHPQFANPDSNFSSPTFGVISSTAVSARVGQAAIRWSF